MAILIFIIIAILLLILFMVQRFNNPLALGTSKLMASSEVYCIGKNIYRYVAAKDACREQGGRLATTAEVQQAYKDGADWCTLGWVQDEKAYYPAQYGSKGCHSGLHGGKLPPQLKLGAICHGVKPPITNSDVLPWNKLKWNQ